ncbi:MAG TPA: helix-turn-helix transcriptional regulator [Flavobacteriaceae bacterium]|nr:helix-turn-helix transcriptional regulator [Flavobacteriaceae bacterium]
METAGSKLRELRQEKGFSLQEVSSVIDVDIAILSKMERGERKLSREVLEKLAELYKYDLKELLVLFLSDRILYEIKDEEVGEEALKVAEEKIRYLKTHQENRN